MTGDQSKWKHRAFISYSQADMNEARKLQRWLESYRLPGSVAKQTGQKRKLGRLFRDETDLSGAADLGNALKTALDHSEGLIVLCSPNATGSRWVDEEIQHFRATGRTDHIFAVILDGTPNAENPEDECFPPSFKPMVNGQPNPNAIEPLAVNPDADGRDRAYLRLAAGLFNVPFDSLWQRERRRKRRQMAFAGALTTTGMALLVSALIAGWLALNGFANLDRSQSEILSREAGEQFLRESGDHSKSTLLALYGDPAIRRNRVASWFHSDQVYPDAEGRLMRSHLANRLELRVEGEFPLATSVEFSPDGNLILYTSVQGGYGKIIDTNNTKNEQTFQKYTDDFRLAHFSADGQKIAYNSGFGAVQLRPLSAEEDTRSFVSEGGVKTFAFSNQSDWIATAWEKQVEIWEVESGALIKRVCMGWDPSLGDVGTIEEIAFSNDDQLIAVAQNGGFVFIWDLDAFGPDEDCNDIVPIGTLRVPLGDAYLPWMDVAFGQADAEQLVFVGASSDAGGGAAIYDFRDGEKLFETSYTEGIYGQAVADDLSRVAILRDNQVDLWSTAEGGALIGSFSASEANVLSADFSPDGRKLVAGLQNGDVIVWDVSVDTPLDVSLYADLFAPLNARRNWLLNDGVAASADGRFFASGGSAEICITAPETNCETPLFMLRGHGLETGDEWDPSVYQGYAETAEFLEFSPTENVLASIARDRTLRLWDVATGTRKSVWTFVENVRSFAFSPDGRFIAIHAAREERDPKGEVAIWHVETGQKIVTLGTVSAEPIEFTFGNRSAMAFAEDGSVLVLEAGDDTRYAFAVPEFIFKSTREQVAIACERLRSAALPQTFVRADALIFPSLLGEALDSETDEFTSPCE